jgi:hypothetical protein
MRQSKRLRAWSVALTVLGIAALASAAVGMVWLVTSAGTTGQAVAAVAIGVPLALVFAACPLALAQALRALADIAEDMAFDSLTTRASSPY